MPRITLYDPRSRLSTEDRILGESAVAHATVQLTILHSFFAGLQKLSAFSQAPRSISISRINS